MNDKISRSVSSSPWWNTWKTYAAGVAITIIALIALYTSSHRKPVHVLDVNSTIIQVVTSSPNGVVTAKKGSLAIDVTTPTIWQNTDGATLWVQFISGSIVQQSVYYGDGSDGTCAFDGVTTPVCGATLSGAIYTMARDIAAMNMTVSTGVTLRTDNFRVFVYSTLTLTGTGSIASNGDAAAGRLGGNGAGRTTRYYASCIGDGGNGANGGGAGGAASANGNAIPQWPAQATTAAGANGGGHGQGGGGGTTGANAGAGGGAIANGSVNSGYFTAVGGFTGKADSIGTNWALCGSGGGGGGSVGGAALGGGGGGAGGFVFVGANQCTGSGTIAAVGGNGGSPTLGGGTGAGGGGGGGGGVIAFIYSHRAGGGCTTNVAGGTGTTGVGTGTNGGNGSSGSALTYNLSGDGT